MQIPMMLISIQTKGTPLTCPALFNCVFSRTRSIARREDSLNGSSQRVDPSLLPSQQHYLLSPRGTRQQRTQPTLHADGYFMHGDCVVSSLLYNIFPLHLESIWQSKVKP